MKKILLTILALTLVASVAKTVLASSDRLPETMKGQVTAIQNNVNYYGGFTGNEAVYNYTNDDINPSGPSGQSAVTTTSTGDKRWVAVGRGDGDSVKGMQYSTDGITWQPTGSDILETGNNVAWNGTVWVAVGNGTNNSIATSTDGITWTPQGKKIGDWGFSIAWNGSVWVAVGRGVSGSGQNKIAIGDSNGANWTQLTSPIIGDNKDVIWNGRQFLIVGEASTGQHTFATSPDGVTWTGRGKTILGSGATWSARGLAWNGYLYVAVGAGTGGHSIATSPDGVTWTGRGNAVTGGTGVAWNGSQFTAVGDGLFPVATSPDGKVWTGQSADLAKQQMNRFTNIVWTGDKWVATGDYYVNPLSSAPNVVTSDNGIDWTVIDGLLPFYTGGASGIYTNFSLFADGNLSIGYGGNDLFGFEENSLTSTTDGCIYDIIFNQPNNRCFFSNSKNSNVRVMSSRTYVNSGMINKPVLELAALYYPPKATIAGDAYLNSLDPANFAYWGRNLVQSDGSASPESFWGMSGYTNNIEAQATLDENGSEYIKYLAKIKELKGEAAPLIASDLAGIVYLQTDQPSIRNVNPNTKYPNGKVWYVPGDPTNPIDNITLDSNIIYQGTGTIIFGGNVTIASGVDITSSVPTEDKLGIICMGDLTISGNNTINAAIFSYGSINFTGSDVDLVGSFVADSFTGLTVSDANTNIRFYYDRRLDSGWPPGFRYLNMPHPTEN